MKVKQLYIVVESFQVQKYYSKAVFSSLITFLFSACDRRRYNVHARLFKNSNLVDGYLINTTMYVSYIFLLVKQSSACRQHG